MLVLRCLLPLCLLLCSCTLASEVDNRISAALQAYGQAEGASITFLAGGMDHVMAHAHLKDGRDCVLRLLNYHRSVEEVQREVEATQLAANCGVAPQVYFYDPAQRVLILEYLPPDDDPVDEAQMIEKLKKVHQASCLKTAASLQPFGFIDNLWWGICGRTETPMLCHLRQAVEVVSQIHLALKHHPPVLSHGDFHRGNVIKSRGKVYLIDWTTAALGDRFYDLAKYTLLAAPERRDQLLALYCGKEPLEGERAHFYLARMATLMTIVLNRYSCIEHTPLEALETTDFTHVTLRAMHTEHGKRLGALKALRLFDEMAHADTFKRSLMIVARQENQPLSL